MEVGVFILKPHSQRQSPVEVGVVHHQAAQPTTAAVHFTRGEPEQEGVGVEQLPFTVQGEAPDGQCSKHAAQRPVHACVHVCVCTFVCMFVYVCVCTFMCVYMCVYVCVRVYVCVVTRACVCGYVGV